jgi:DNA polymerase-1
MMVYELIRDLGEFNNYIDYDKPVFCDTETCIEEGKTDGGLYGLVRLVQIYQSGWDKAIIFDCFFIELRDVLDIIKNCHLVFHNAAYDLHTINIHTPNFWYPVSVDDTLYLSRLEYSTKLKFDFYSCLKYAKCSDSIVENISKTENQKYDWSGPILSSHFEYAAYDVIYLEKLYNKVAGKRDTKSYKLDTFNLKYAVEYDRRGIPINRDKIKVRLNDALAKLENILDQLPINPNSPKQCQEYLGTKSTDMDTLVKLSLEGNDQAAQIREARQLSKEINYLKRYDRDILYGFHNPSGARSGRFSCTGGDRFNAANTQQIPRRILPCIQAPPGHVIVYKDYAGLELRMGVAWVGEPTMEAMMRKGVDLHSYTGCILYNVDLETLTKIQRLVGKILNFGLIYGVGVMTAQSTLRAWGGIVESIKNVKILINKWFEEYEYFKAWHNIVKRHFDVYNYVDTYTALGRHVRAYSLNDALNIPIQGSSSEVTKVSLKMLKERYPKEYLINTIHDSNALIVKEDEAEDWVNALNECMVDAWYYVIKNLAIPDLPMPAEAEYKINWEF